MNTEYHKMKPYDFITFINVLHNCCHSSVANNQYIKRDLTQIYFLDFIKCSNDITNALSDALPFPNGIDFLEFTMPYYVIQIFNYYYPFIYLLLGIINSQLNRCILRIDFNVCATCVRMLQVIEFKIRCGPFSSSHFRCIHRNIIVDSRMFMSFEFQ